MYSMTLISDSLHNLCKIDGKRSKRKCHLCLILFGLQIFVIRPLSHAAVPVLQMIEDVLGEGPVSASRFSQWFSSNMSPSGSRSSSLRSTPHEELERLAGLIYPLPFPYCPSVFMYSLMLKQAKTCFIVLNIELFCFLKGLNHTTCYLVKVLPRTLHLFSHHRARIRWISWTFCKRPK